MRKSRFLFFGAGFFLLLAILHTPLLTFMGNFLIITDPLEKKDIIIVLSGSSTGHRVAKGVELYKKGYAYKIIMIGTEIQWNTYEQEIMKDHAVDLGVPESDVEAVNQGQSTYAQAKKMVEVMKNKGYKSAIVVTSDYHTRRTEYIFDKIFLPASVNVIVSPSPSGRFDAEEWWKNADYAKTVFYEYTKLLWYWVRY